MKTAATWPLLCVLIFLPPAVSAGEESVPGAWEPVSAGPATTWTAPMMAKGTFSVQPFFYYNRTRAWFDDDGNSSALPEGDKKTQFQQYFFFQYGITDIWEVSAQALFQQTCLTQGGAKAHDQGVGDSYLFTRYKLAGERGWLPEATGLLQLKVPTGKYQHEDPDKLGADLTGTGSWDPGFGINLTKRLKPFILHGDVIAGFPREVSVNGVKTRYANYLNCDAAVEYFIPGGFSLMVELNGFAQGDQEEDGEEVPDTGSSSLILSPGIGWASDRVQALLAYQRTLSGTNADANDSVMFTFIYTF